jgi:hypothetical protein
LTFIPLRRTLSFGLIATLDEIVEVATDNKQPITVLLRKCLVLAHQLKNDRLKAWANQELNGYQSSENLPEYRILGVHTVGDYSGPFNSGVRNMPIPAYPLREEHRHWVTTVCLTQSIGTLQNIASNTTDRSIHFPWPADLVALYQDLFETENGMVLVAANRILSTSAVAGLLENVRNRTLNMALELQTELGEQDLKKITPAEKEQIDRTITTIIFGGTNVFASGQSQVNASITGSQQVINVGNRAELDAVLKRSGLSDEDLEELSQAEKEDGPEKMGKGVMGWIKKTAPKVLAGGVKIGTEIGQKLLTEWLKHYCGLS